MSFFSFCNNNYSQVLSLRHATPSFLVKLILGEVFELAHSRAYQRILFSVNLISYVPWCIVNTITQVENLFCCWIASKADFRTLNYIFEAYFLTQTLEFSNRITNFFKRTATWRNELVIAIKKPPCPSPQCVFFCCWNIHQSDLEISKRNLFWVAFRSMCTNLCKFLISVDSPLERTIECKK